MAAWAQGPVQTASVASSLSAPGAARIGAARLGDHGDKTRFVLELTRDAPFAILPDANGVVVEMEAALDAVLPPPKGLVRAVGVRAGAKAGRLRLVLTTNGPVRVLLAEVIPPRDGMPPRFIMDLAAGTAGPGAVLTPASVTTLNPPVPKEKPKPPLPMIVIDPGHGGQDPGAIAVGGGYEKDLTLAMAKEVRRQLLATGRYRVALTRDKDMFIPLRDRPAIARAKGADLFISLHADSITSKQIRGLSIYTLSDKASDKEAEMLAQRENQSDAIVGMDLSGHRADVANILIGLSQRDTMNQSRRFAATLLKSLDPNIAVLPGPLRSAGFAVLTAPDVPAVLVEMGYLSHSQDAKLLSSDTHRKRMASSLLRAVDGYFAGNASSPRS
ncbi:N-acetylmuramoyl-L-alanine amidase family protein [Niveispirillum sp. KHB5.9]|uniref:N-acetylmuramoyl-L-alanine amidase family protein n=1 Tax=Niveispirillum sp. KHB5.9 TaxID=3400269 RepID=UPI003A8B0A81